MDGQRHHHYHVYRHFRQLWAISSLAVREGIAQLEGIGAGDDDDVSTSRVLRDDMLDIDLVQRSGLHQKLVIMMLMLALTLILMMMMKTCFWQLVMTKRIQVGP